MDKSGAGSLLTTGDLSNTIYGNSPSVSSHLSGKKVTANFTNGFSGLGAGKDGSSGPLPVIWLSFTGNRSNMEVDLTWKTSLEINNSHFEIERLIEGETGFTNVGEMKGNGTTSQISIYNYKDFLPSISIGKTIYYRLKQIDFNGKFDYSKKIGLNQNFSTFNFNIYPNPTSGNFIVTLPKTTTDGVIEISNMYGQVIYRKEIDKNYLEFIIYEKGLYMICVYSNGNKLFQKLLIN